MSKALFLVKKKKHTTRPSPNPLQLNCFFLQDGRRPRSPLIFFARRSATPVTRKIYVQNTPSHPHSQTMVTPVPKNRTEPRVFQKRRFSVVWTEKKELLKFVDFFLVTLKNCQNVPYGSVTPKVRLGKSWSPCCSNRPPTVL